MATNRYATRRTGPPAISTAPLQKTSAPSIDKNKGKSTAKPLVFTDVIEISSDEDEGPQLPQKRKPPPPANSASLSRLEKEVKKLKEENARLAQKQAQSEKELERHKKEKEKNTIRLDVSDLEELISCEICTMKLWTPCILSGCGHTFCQSCLQDWFSTTLAQHMTTYPHYDVNQRLPTFVQDAVDLQPQYAPLFLQQYAPALPPQPPYTCPTCRAPVKSRPIEDYSLKAVVRTVAKAQRESSPRKPPPPARRRGREEGPWDGFFPRA
ncbi:hypothetical protein V5O48_000171 [Marasmius crinis-equi]|uniref:RING-type domain-containing protein n=1 Tax=Marasmius crinis-equi TaxID=585013 RepID=A0ABR3G293_9AGAR